MRNPQIGDATADSTYTRLLTRLASAASNKYLSCRNGLKRERERGRGREREGERKEEKKGVKQRETNCNLARITQAIPTTVHHSPVHVLTQMYMQLVSYWYVYTVTNRDNVDFPTCVILYCVCTQLCVALTLLVQ